MRLFFILLLLLTVAYAPCSIAFCLPLRRFLRAATALLLFFLAIVIQVILFTGILPRPALLPAAWLSGTMIFATPMLFARDMVVLFLRSRGRKPGKWNRFLLFLRICV